MGVGGACLIQCVSQDVEGIVALCSPRVWQMPVKGLEGPREGIVLKPGRVWVEWRRDDDALRLFCASNLPQLLCREPIAADNRGIDTFPSSHSDKRRCPPSAARWKLKC